MSLISNNTTLMLKGIVTSTPDKDPMGAGRYQVYIPSIHGKLDANRVGQGIQNDNSTTAYPWAEYLAYTDTTPTIGTYVLIGLQGNDYNSMVILGKYGNIESTCSSITSSVAGGDLLELAVQVIFGNEGNYESVNWNDNGAISIGKIQWHANRAKNLLKLIRTKNESKFDEKASGTSLTSDLNSDWSNWIYYSEESATGKALKSILATDESHTAQDEQALEDVNGYISTAQAGGITDPKCLIYIADIINQYGSCSSLISQKINDLDKLHQYALANGYGTYASRRQATYNKIKELDLQGKFTVNVLSTEGEIVSTSSGIIGWPTTACSVRDKITSEFGKRGSGFHNGIDIGVPIGSDIIAPIDGTVFSLVQNGEGVNFGGTGNIYDEINDGVTGYGYYQVVIADKQINGKWYGVLMAHENQKGTYNNVKVQRGTKIGKSGNTGNSTGPHIHFEVRVLNSGTATYANFRSGTAIDPKSVL